MYILRGFLLHILKGMVYNYKTWLILKNDLKMNEFLIILCHPVMLLSMSKGCHKIIISKIGSDLLY